MKMSLIIKRIKKINDREFEFEVEAKTRTTFKIGKQTKEILEDVAQRKGISLSDLIREALKEDIHKIYDLGRDDRISLAIRLDILRELDRLAVRFNVPRTYIFHSKIVRYLEKEGIEIG
jgi:hypothetical protein